ncbi:Protein HIRA [Hypsibius exemplaris]|uniref:Protein HIRA n=1 Tax=Hypsibius exemplaris TaxID=2072580 RepID=A0A1W0XAU0_HYPEX|nr:Protein HIRA [Hypsibius exemplaris]
MAKGISMDSTSKTNKKVQETVTNGHSTSDKSPRISKHDAGFILKMKFASFDKSAIYSVNIHPDGSRFAASGLGDGCGRIVVWHVNAFRADRADIRVICQMDNHTACVNCVRWSNKGLYLASAGDDSFVMIWQQTRVNESENWRCVHTLRKHTGDVFGVAWSKNDAFLASCSVDNSIIVWDAQKSFEAVQVLTGHTGMVKGVVWDPIGKYLASQSDDGSLRIWRTSDWKQQHCSEDSFDAADGTTQLLRLDWSTDGMNIVSAHATNEGRPIAQIVERPRDTSQDGWKSTNYLAGHARPVVCVKFNPRMFVAPEENMKNAAPYCVCATGSRDHTVCIWSFQHKRPHVFTGIFKDPVMDISWFPDGYSLLACSMDGTVAYIHCGKLITGIAITKEQQFQALSKLFTKSVVDAATSFIGSHNIVESSAFLDAQEAESQRLAKGSAGRSTADAQDQVVRLPYEGIPLVQQIETVLADGRRKITPVFIPEVAAAFVAPSVFSEGRGDDKSQEGNSSRGETSGGQTENADPGTLPPDVVMGHPKGPSVLDAVLRSVPSNNRQALKEKFTAPSTSKEPEPKSHKASRPPEPKRQRVENAESKAKASSAKAARLSAGEAPSLSNGQTPSTSKKAASQKNSTGQGGMLDRVLKPPPPPASRQAEPQSQPTPRPPEAMRRTPSNSVRRIPPPPLVAQLQVPVEVKNPSAGGNNDMFTVENDLDPTAPGAPSMTKYHKVRYLTGDRVKWLQYLTSPVVIASAHMGVAAAICRDHSLHIWCSESGSLLSKTQCLTAQGGHMACSNESVFVITVDCRADVWARNHKHGPWKRITLGTIDWMLRLTRGSPEPLSILEVGLTSTGIPVVTLSDQRLFVCDMHDVTWVVAYDESVRFGNYLVSNSAQHTVAGLDINGPLAKLQKTRSGVAIGKQVAPELGRTLILSHMESQLLLCQLLKSATEYRAWLNSYAQCLVDNSASCSSRLMTLLESLMGPDGNDEEATESTWEPEVLGMSKRSLLLQILPILGRKTQLEKIYLGFKQRLDFLETRNLFAMDTD